MKNKFRVLIFLLVFKPFLLSSQNNKIGFEVASGLGIGKKFARLDYQLGVFRYWNLTDYSRFQLGLNISWKNNLVQAKTPKSVSVDTSTTPNCTLFCAYLSLFDVRQTSIFYCQMPISFQVNVRKGKIMFGATPAIALGGTLKQYEREQRDGTLRAKTLKDFSQNATSRSINFENDGLKRFDILWQLGVKEPINANCDFGVTIYRSLINQNLNPQFNGMYHTSLLFSVDYYFRNK